MAILVNCRCGQSYSVRDEFAGQPVQCAVCSQVVYVPAAPLPSPGPRLRVGPALPDASLSGTAGPARVPVAAIGVLLLLCLAGVLFVVNFEHIQGLFGSGTEQRVEVDPPDPPDEESNIKQGVMLLIQEKPPAEPKKDDKPPPKKVDPPEPKEPPVPIRHPAFEGHSATIYRVALTADGRLALSAAGGVVEVDGKSEPAGDTTIRLWDVKTGQQMKRLRDFPGGIAAAAFSPGGRLALLAAAGKKTADGWKPGADHDLHLWDLNDDKELRTFSGHLGEVNCVALSPDGKKAVSGGRDRILRVWEVQTGKEIDRLVGHTNTVNAVAFSPDNRHVLSAGSDMTVRWWDLERGAQLKQLPGHEDIVWAVAVSPDGKLGLSAGGYQPGQGNRGLVPGAKDFAIRLWDLTTGTVVRKLEGHTEAVASVAFSPDGQRVVSAGADRTVRLWQAASGRAIRSFKGHEKLIHTVAVSADGARALSGGDLGALRAWVLPPDLQALVRLVREEKDVNIRTRAAEELALYGPDARAAIPDLYRAAHGPDLKLREASLSALGAIGKPSVEQLPMLIGYLSAETPADVRGQVLDALALLGPEAIDAVPALGKVMKDPEPGLRAQAAKTLGALGKTNRAATRPLLLDALRDSDAVVAKTAREALAVFGPPAPAERRGLTALLADPSETIRRYALDSLASLKADAAQSAPDFVRIAKTDPSVELRRQSLLALLEVNPRDPTTLGAFVDALKDAKLARHAVECLAKAGPEVGLPGLLTALEHKDPDVAKAADEVLQKTTWDKTHANPLTDALPGAGPKGRPLLLKALLALGAEAADAVPGLRAVLRETPDPKEVLLLIELLVKIGAPAKAAGPELVLLLKRDPKVKDNLIIPSAAAHALVELEADEVAEAAPVLVSALRIEDDKEETLERRTRVAKALQKIGKPAIPHLLKGLTGEFFVGNARTPAGTVRAVGRYSIIDTLAAMGPKVAATPEVFRALANLERAEPYIEIRQAAFAVRMMLMMKDDPDKKEPEKKDPEIPDKKKEEKKDQ